MTAPGPTIARPVRFDAPTRARLDALAAASDRTLVQLVKYALTAFLDAGAPGLAGEGPVGSGSLARHLSVRLPADLVHRVDQVSLAAGCTYSEVVRAAVVAWLDGVDAASLGAPVAAGAGVGA